MAAPFIWGLFYEFTAYITAVFIMIALVATYVMEHKFQLSINLCSVTLGIFTIAYWLSIIPAIDRGIAILGALKFTVPFLFYILVCQLGDDDRERGIQLIPVSGAVMVLVTAIAWVIPVCRDYLYQAGRMGGCFQYSNVMALYLLIGIIVLGYGSKTNIKMYINSMILIIGILMTGSRTVFFLLLLAFAYLAVTSRQLRWKVLAVTLLMIAAGIVYVALTGDFQNIGRFLTTSLKSSTLLGRVLYDIDGVAVLKDHLWGLGYMGYYILQPMIQTGVYTTMFVHNEWLQIGLDAGIIAMLSFFILIVGNMMSKHISIRNKWILIIIALHMIVDFDLQYLSIFFILILCLEYKNENSGFKIQKEGAIRLSVGFTSLIGIIYGYFAVVGMLYFIGNLYAADQLYPWDSRVKTDLMLASSDVKTADELADEILELDKYSYAAYNIKAVAAMEKMDYEEMIGYKKKGLIITRYSIEEYMDYMVMLNKAIDNSSTEEEVLGYINDLLEIEGVLEEIKEGTHPLAYQIQDQPELELPEKYQQYLEYYKEILMREEKGNEK